MAFKEMRRKQRALPREAAEQILSAGQYGVLSVYGEEGYPYGVPVNYGYAEGKLLFHCAREGHKLQAIRRNPKVCFTVVSGHTLVEEEYTCKYESVVVFGTARVIEERKERHAAMERMMSVLSPDYAGTAIANCGGDGYVMVEITPDHVTGKRNR